MGWTARIVLAVIVLLVVGAGVLGFIESGKAPPPHAVDVPVPVPAGG